MIASLALCSFLLPHRGSLYVRAMCYPFYMAGVKLNRRPFLCLIRHAAHACDGCHRSVAMVLTRLGLMPNLSEEHENLARSLPLSMGGPLSPARICDRLLYRPCGRRMSVSLSANLMALGHFRATPLRQGGRSWPSCLNRGEMLPG